METIPPFIHGERAMKFKLVPASAYLMKWAEQVHIWARGGVLCSFLAYANWISRLSARWTPKKKKQKKNMKHFLFRNAARRSPRQLKVLRRFVSVQVKKKKKSQVCRQKTCMTTAATSRGNTTAVLSVRWWNLQEFTLNPWLNIYSALKVLPIWIQSNALLFPPKADYLWIFGLTSEPKGLKQFT